LHTPSAPVAAVAALIREERMSNPNDLKTIGLKATLPRLKILEIFQTTDHRHMSAEDVYKHLLTANMDIGLATVYRVLTQFEQAGLLARNHFDNGKAVFELNQGTHHDHLVCLTCGKVEEFYDGEIEKRQQRIAKERGFVLQEHALSMYGVCTKPNCEGRSRSQSAPRFHDVPA
jgi:Fur family ferric uptake transcriptional regulator